MTSGHDLKQSEALFYRITQTDSSLPQSVDNYYTMLSKAQKACKGF